MTISIPAAIDKVAAEFRSDISGADVTTEHVTGIRWRVTVTSARVRMWVEYETRSRGRLQSKNSQLHIDGQQVQRAASYPELTRIFADPDNGRAAPPGPPTDADEMVAVTVDEAPQPVRAMHAKVVAAAPKGFDLVVRHAGRHWYVCLENPTAQMRVVFVERLMVHTRPLREREVTLANKRQSIQLVINGEDLSAQVAGMLDKALGMMVGHAGTPAPAAVSRESGVAVRPTGVQVRNTAVIRN